MKKTISLKSFTTILLLTIAIYETNAQTVVVRSPRPAVVYHPRYVRYVPPVVRVARPVRVVPVAPAVPVVVSTLPVGYRVCWFGAVPYYYYNGVYYTKIEESENYEAVQPPVGTIIIELPKDAIKKTIDNSTYYEYQGVLYKKIKVENSTKYEVVGYTNK